MPMFDYQCKACGYVFEALELKRDEQKEIKCPRCGSIDVKKLPASFATLSFGCGSKGFFS